MVKRPTQSLKAGTRIQMKTPSGDMGTIGHWRKVNGPVKNDMAGSKGWHVVHFDLGGTLIVHENAFTIEPKAK